MFTHAVSYLDPSWALPPPIYIHMYIHIFKYVNTYIFVCIYVYVHLFTYIYVCVCVYIYTCLNIYVCGFGYFLIDRGWGRNVSVLIPVSEDRSLKKFSFCPTALTNKWDDLRKTCCCRWEQSLIIQTSLSVALQCNVYLAVDLFHIRFPSYSSLLVLIITMNSHPLKARC